MCSSENTGEDDRAILDGKSRQCNVDQPGTVRSAWAVVRIIRHALAEKYMNDGEPGDRGRGVAPKTKEAMAARPMGTGDAPFIGADMDDDEGIIHQERRVSSAQSQISNQRGGGLHPNF